MVNSQEQEVVDSQESFDETLTSDFEKLLGMVDLDEENNQAATRGHRLSQAVNHFVTELCKSEQPLERLDRAAVEAKIDELDARLSKQISAIMHHEVFQSMESSWRSLKYFVDHTDFRSNIKIEILDVSKDDLAEDFDDCAELIESGLFHHTYKSAFDQAGANPVAAVIGNFEFDHKDADIGLLKDISGVCAASHAPFLSAVSSNLFGKKSPQAVNKIKDFEELFEQDKYTKWRALRNSEDARYLGLTFPRFLLRAPYNADNTRKGDFKFHEDVGGEDHERLLWGNAAFALAARMSDSFARHGWCVNIRGPQSGGAVEDLPLFYYDNNGERKPKIPSELSISDRMELELAEAGIVPLVHYMGTDHACFFSVQSLQKPTEYDTPEATANAKMAANLPYMMLASRLSHYLRAIQRENIGSFKDKATLQKELDRWIRQLVTKMDNPDPILKSERPLAEAEIIVNDIPSAPGFYDVKMRIRPHFQFEGVNVELSLVSRLQADN